MSHVSGLRETFSEGERDCCWPKSQSRGGEAGISQGRKADSFRKMWRSYLVVVQVMRQVEIWRRCRTDTIPGQAPYTH